MNIKELESKITYYAQKYYEGKTEISDAEFDSLVYELKRANPASKILSTTGWGYFPNTGKKVKHVYGGMKSISNKPRSIEGIPIYYSFVRISPKYDGISCAIYFKNGMIDFAATRGNGDEGIDISDKIMSMSIRIIPTQGFTGAIRGELIMTNSDWEDYHKNNPNAKDPRNAVAGIINRNTVDGDIKYITFKPYKVIANEISDTNAIYLTSEVNYIIDTIFDSRDEFIVSERCNITQEFLEEVFMNYREKYPCDGLVITSDDVRVSDGGVFNYDEVAYKFDGNIQATEVTDIWWNRTRTGKLIPTIIFNPVELDGATIRRCAGFNAKFIKDNGIGIGSEITIMRSGGVIPDCQDIVKSTDPYLPDVCPCCGNKLDWEGVNLVCKNKDCSGSDEADLHVWVNSIASVHGLGYNIKKSFFDSTQIESVEDLYTRNITLDSRTSTGMKLKEMWDKLHVEDIDPVCALVALNIPRLGWTSAKKIADNKVLFYKIINNTGVVPSDVIIDLASVVGKATAKSIEINSDKLYRLRFIKDRIKYAENEVKSEDIGDIESKGEVVITGKLNTCKRSEFEKIISSAGYILVPAVREGVMYLITNTPDSGSSKNKKADQLGIKKITEDEFLEMIGYEK